MQNFTTSEFNYYKESLLLVLSKELDIISETISVKSEHTGRTVNFDLVGVLECGRLLYEPVVREKNVSKLVVYPQLTSKIYKDYLASLLNKFDEMYQFSDDRNYITQHQKIQKRIGIVDKVITANYKD